MDSQSGDNRPRRLGIIEVDPVDMNDVDGAEFYATNTSVRYMDIIIYSMVNNQAEKARIQRTEGGEGVSVSYTGPLCQSYLHFPEVSYDEIARRNRRLVGIDDTKEGSGEYNVQVENTNYRISSTEKDGEINLVIERG